MPVKAISYVIDGEYPLYIELIETIDDKKTIKLQRYGKIDTGYVEIMNEQISEVIKILKEFR